VTTDQCTIYKSCFCQFFPTGLAQAFFTPPSWVLPSL
jgi:hypothetical protein